MPCKELVFVRRCNKESALFGIRWYWQNRVSKSSHPGNLVSAKACVLLLRSVSFEPVVFVREVFLVGSDWLITATALPAAQGACFVAGRGLKSVLPAR